MRAAGRRPGRVLGTGPLGRARAVPGVARVTQPRRAVTRRAPSVVADASCAGGAGEARCGPGITDARQVAVGAFFRCVLRTGGGVLCWGDNDAGALGNGGTADSGTPVPVTGVAGAVRVAAGGDRACAVDASGAVTCWGAGQPVPAVVPGLAGATEVAVADDFACALHSGGRVACWGRAGEETTSTSNGGGLMPTWHAGPAPADVPGVAGAVGLAAGGSAGCAVGRGGHVACWGDNAYGTLGDGSRLTSIGAVIVEGSRTPVRSRSAPRTRARCGREAARSAGAAATRASSGTGVAPPATAPSRSRASAERRRGECRRSRGTIRPSPGCGRGRRA